MTRERLEDLALEVASQGDSMTRAELVEVVALARRGLECMALSCTMHPSEDIAALRRACELARDLASLIREGRVVLPYRGYDPRDLYAALAAVGLPVEKEAK